MRIEASTTYRKKVQVRPPCTRIDVTLSMKGSMKFLQPLGIASTLMKPTVPPSLGLVQTSPMSKSLGLGCCKGSEEYRELINGIAYPKGVQ